MQEPEHLSRRFADIRRDAELGSRSIVVSSSASSGPRSLGGNVPTFSVTSVPGPELPKLTQRAK
jgi:hypothetical protein